MSSDKQYIMILWKSSYEDNLKAYFQYISFDDIKKHIDNIEKMNVFRCNTFQECLFCYKQNMYYPLQNFPQESIITGWDYRVPDNEFKIILDIWNTYKDLL